MSENLILIFGQNKFYSYLELGFGQKGIVQQKGKVNKLVQFNQQKYKVVDNGMEVRIYLFKQNNFFELKYDFQ